MNVLVTAGNTMAMIDRVRCLTNVFTGRTGAGIALEAHRRGHRVTLLTSHPEAAADLAGGQALQRRWSLKPYRTFEDLQKLMEEHIAPGGFDAVVHCAAVSDYLFAGVYAPAEGSRFDPATGRWEGSPPALADRAAGKVKSDEPELWLRLVRAPKLIDRVRGDWGYRGLLVKFKLEVGLSDAELVRVGERSRAHSGADLLVANTLEGAAHYAFLIAQASGSERVSRDRLPHRLMEVLEAFHSHVPGAR